MLHARFARAKVSIRLTGDVAIEVDAASSEGTANTMVIRVSEVATALGVNVSSVSGLTASPDRQSLTFSLDRQGAANTSSGLSDGDISGRLASALKTWAPQVDVQRVAGSMTAAALRKPLLCHAVCAQRKIITAQR